MDRSNGAGPRAPRGIAGGFVLVPARQLLVAWRACRRKPLGAGDFRAWLACHEMIARRCRIGDRRSPTYGFDELARLSGVAEKRAKGSVKRLVAAGLLVWDRAAIAFPDRGDPGDDALADTIGRGGGDVAVPRRVLRFLSDGARPALIVTALGVLLRCLARKRGGFEARGRIKAAWIAHVFDVDVRRVKGARKELIDRGWLVSEPADQWALNRWGGIYHIDLAWSPAEAGAGRRLPPPPAAGGRQLPPPESDLDPLREEKKNQEPALGGPAGFDLDEKDRDPIPPVGGICRSAGEEAGPRRADAIAGVAAGASVPPPTLRDVRAEDLKDTGRLLQLHKEAVRLGRIGASEADRLRFVSAAEHARAIGTRNPPGLFVSLVKSRRWSYLTGDDEDSAVARLKFHEFGPPRRLVEEDRVRAPAVVSSLSSDGRLVRAICAALRRTGYRGDPFPAIRARDPSWTRSRWDVAMAETGVSQERRR